MGINKMDSQKLVVRLEMNEKTLRLLKETVIDAINQNFDYLHEVYSRRGFEDEKKKSIEDLIDDLYEVDEQLSDAMEEYDLDL